MVRCARFASLMILLTTVSAWAQAPALEPLVSGLDAARFSDLRSRWFQSEVHRGAAGADPRAAAEIIIADGLFWIFGRESSAGASAVCWASRFIRSMG